MAAGLAVRVKRAPGRAAVRGERRDVRRPETVRRDKERGREAERSVGVQDGAFDLALGKDASESKALLVEHRNDPRSIEVGVGTNVPGDEVHAEYEADPRVLRL